jgi:RNase H-fold protein (predicted Holliday junction resolvase)
MWNNILILLINTMTKKKTKILAIDPGTKEMGVAFLEKGKLIHYGVKSIKKKRSPHQLWKKEGR